MEAESSWLHVLKDTLFQAAKGLVRLIPNILGAVMVIVAGWLLAKLLRTLAVRGLHTLTRTVTSLRRNATAHRPLMEDHTNTTNNANNNWATILLFLTAATQVLG